MRFNLSKCVTLKCYRSLSPILTDYFINDHKLENVKEHSYLGIIIDQSMSFISISIPYRKLFFYG